MKSEEKIFIVLQTIKNKIDLAPTGSIINYRAGMEGNKLATEDEVLILNKLANENIIEVIDNFGSETI